MWRLVNGYIRFGGNMLSPAAGVVSAGGRLTMRLHLDGHLGALPSGSNLGVIRSNYLYNTFDAVEQ